MSFLCNLKHRNLIILIAIVVFVIFIYSFYSASVPSDLLISLSDDYNPELEDSQIAHLAGHVPSRLGDFRTRKRKRRDEHRANAVHAEQPLHRGKFKFRAAVYARPTFHEEIVSTIACMLYDAGMEVNVYIGSGLSYGRLTLPMSQQRMHNSDMFFGTHPSFYPSAPYAPYVFILR